MIIKGDKKPKKSADGRSITKRGKALSKMLGPTLLERGVPSTRYIIVDIDSGAFVTGCSPEEATVRFKFMHPSANGWLERVSGIF